MLLCIRTVLGLKCKTVIISHKYIFYYTETNITVVIYATVQINLNKVGLL